MEQVAPQIQAGTSPHLPPKADPESKTGDIDRRVLLSEAALVDFRSSVDPKLVVIDGFIREFNTAALLETGYSEKGMLGLAMDRLIEGGSGWRPAGLASGAPQIYHPQRVTVRMRNGRRRRALLHAASSERSASAQRFTVVRVEFLDEPGS